MHSTDTLAQYRASRSAGIGAPRSHTVWHYRTVPRSGSTALRKPLTVPDAASQYRTPHGTDALSQYRILHRQVAYLASISIEIRTERQYWMFT
eukprot:3818327-Rhodomonas_salina.2